MKSRLYLAILSLLGGITLYSQEIDVALQTDTIALEDESAISPQIISPMVYSRIYNPASFYTTSSPGPSYYQLGISPYLFEPGAVMPRIPGLGGYVASTSLPGLMGIESGSLSYALTSDHISFTPSVYVSKYGYYGGLTTSIGVGGQLSLRINERFSVTAFGAYHTNSWAANPAVLANMQSTRFGGYGTWSLNDRWSLSSGAQRVQNCATNHWQTVPIIMPTYKINDKASIGIDVGGLLYEIVDWHRSKSAHSHGNPTIAPPIMPQMNFPPFKP